MLISVHGIVFYRIAGALYFFFWCTLPLFAVVVDGVVVLRIAVQPLRLLIPEGIERVGRLEGTPLVHRYSVV